MVPTLKLASTCFLLRSHVWIFCIVCRLATEPIYLWHALKSVVNRESELNVRIRQKRLEWIQKVILRRLGMSSKPNISSSVISEKERTDLVVKFENIYRETEDEGSNDNEDDSGNEQFYAKRFKTNPPSCKLLLILT